MSNKCYVLEVVRYITEKEGNTKEYKQQHVGYMKAKFRTTKDACSYYYRHNVHMRRLNIFGTYESDWDPNTKLKYIVRRDYHLMDAIDPFSPSDLPINGKYIFLQ
jgi:hypothetical protein